MFCDSQLGKAQEKPIPQQSQCQGVGKRRKRGRGVAPPALSKSRRKSGSARERSVTCQQLLQTPGTAFGNPQSTIDT